MAWSRTSSPGSRAFKWLFVIARNSTFTYKGRSVDVKQVGHELGVRYMLEGSVRKAAGRVRITTQLIEPKPAHMSGPSATTVQWTTSLHCRMR